MRAGRCLAAALLLASCAARTEIVPVLRDTTPPKVFTSPPTPAGGCDVRDYSFAAELPPGSQNLGWVEVPRTESDEETAAALRTKICSLGGNALSQLAWETKPGERVASALKANAWKLP